MLRTARTLLFAILPTLTACGLSNENVNPGATYAQLGDLTLVTWASNIAPNGDLILSSMGRLYRWQVTAQTWINIPSTGLPSAQPFYIAASSAGDYMSVVVGGVLSVLPAGQNTWSQVTLPAPELSLNMAALSADGTLYAVSEATQGTGKISRIDRRPVAGGTWTPVYNNAGSSTLVQEIKFIYPNGDLWVNGQNLGGKNVLRAGQTALEAGYDCTGNVVRPYCEGNGFTVFAPNGDQYLTYGGLGSRTVYKAKGSSFPLVPQAIGSLPDNLVNFTVLVALNDGTLVGFGEQSTKSLFRLTPGATTWQDLGTHPYEPALVYSLANAQGQVFFFGRQCCFAPLPIARLAR